METIGFIASVSPRIAGKFLKIHVWNDTHIHYQHYAFGLMGLKIRALYMKSRKFFRLISRPIEGFFLKIHIGHCAHIR